MKKILFTLFLITGLNVSAQLSSNDDDTGNGNTGGISDVKKICFEYDAAGNQILRILCSNCISRNATITKSIAELKKEDLQKFFPEDVISYYPNPVKDELYLKWELINNNYVKSIEIYHFNGQFIKKIESLEHTDNQIISFQDYPVGVFIINLKYADGNQKDIKIIKK